MTIRARIERVAGVERDAPFRWPEDCVILFLICPGIVGSIFMLDWWLGWPFDGDAYTWISRGTLAIAVAYLALRTRRKIWVWFLCSLLVSPFVTAIALVSANVYRYIQERRMSEKRPDENSGTTDFVAVTVPAEDFARQDPQDSSNRGPRMDTDAPKKASSPLRWIISVVVVLFFVGARQLHPGGIRGIVVDALVEADSNPQTEQLRKTMHRWLIPVAASAICIDEFGEDLEIIAAVGIYNERAESEQKRVLAELKVLGGMTQREKDYEGRKAMRAARAILAEGRGSAENCKALADRINSREFDL